VLAELNLTLEGGSVRGVIPDNAAPPGQAFYVAVKWPGTNPVRLTERGLSGQMVGGFLDPPQGVRTLSADGRCARAEGILLGYLHNVGTLPNPAVDELVAASHRPDGLFLRHQSYQQRIVWDTCGLQKQQLVPLLVQRDPRLTLALCEQPSAGGMLCGQPMLDRTRVASAQLEVQETSGQFFPSLVAVPPGMAVSIEVNGNKSDAPNEQLVTATTRCTTNPWHAGSNLVRIVVGDAPAWEARVVLPTPSNARLREPGLRKNGVFNIDWNAAPWAGAEVRMWPVNLPLRRAVYPTFSSAGPFLSGTFAGFPGNAGAEWDTQVNVQHTLARVVDFAPGAKIRSAKIPKIRSARRSND
jgi:hypothetical protein